MDTENEMVDETETATTETVETDESTQVEESTSEVVNDEEGGEQDVSDTTAPEAAATDTEAPKRDRSAKARINALTAQKKALERERDRYRKKLELLNSREKENNAGRPDVNEFDSEEEYETANQKYQAEQSAKLTLQVEADLAEEEAEKLRQEEIMLKQDTLIEKGRAKYSNFDEIVSSVPISDSTYFTVLSLENSEDVAMFIGKNREEANRIHNMPPLDAAVALGEISANLKSAASQRNKTTSAPPPVNPVSGGSGSLSTRSIDHMSTKEYVSDRVKELVGGG